MKTVRVFLALILAACLLAGCGGNQNSAGQEADNSSDAQTESEAAESSEETAEAGQPQPIELENFTSGTIYEEGEYYFHIDSMEMTDESYVITYRAATDEQNYSGYYDMRLTINGIMFHEDDFAFSGAGMEGYTMIGGGPDRPITVSIPKLLLSHVGIEEVTSVKFEVGLGYSAQGSVYEEVMIEATVYPGAKTEAADAFPEPKDDAWVLLDNEYGKVQITDANYWVSAADGHIMGITFHLLAKGEGSGNVGLRSIAAGSWESDDSMGDYGCSLPPYMRYFRITLMGGDDPAEGTDFSQSVLSYYCDAGGLEELSTTLDLSGLSNE